MPRQRRPAFEVAVTASPLFKLPLEVRFMIYEMLLIQEGGMFIPSDIFARRNYGRTGSIPYECIYCGLTFLSVDGCMRHVVKHDVHPCWAYNQLSWRLLPEVSISLLQTCRLIRLEASPILYSRNSFHFSDPATASNFRWSTDCAQAGAIQEIGIKLGFRLRKQVIPWLTYLTKRTLNLGQDFPHLRRMTINLGGSLGSVGIESAYLLRSISEKFRERSQGLDWVLVLWLKNEEVLDSFEPLVDREDDSNNGRKEVRRNVWADSMGDPWKNALLWWGCPDEAVPHKYRVIRERLQQQASSDSQESRHFTG